MLVQVFVPGTARRLNPRVPEALSHIVERLMSKQARGRPPTGAVLNRLLLEAAEAGGPDWDMGIYPPAQVPPAEEAPAPAPPPQPPAEAPLEPAPPRLRAHLAWALVPVLSLGLLLGLAAFLHSRKPAVREEAARPLETADLSKLLHKPPSEQAPVPSALSKEPEPVTTANVAPPPAAPAPEQSPPRQARTSTLATRCRGLTASSLLFVELGCAGAQVRPSAGECPPLSAKAMASFGLRSRIAIAVDLAVEQPSKARAGTKGIFQAGKIVSATAEEFEGWPVGTKLYGQLYVDPDANKAWARWTEAQTPGGAGRIPVCLTSIPGDEDDYSFPIDPGSKPDAVIADRVVLVTPHFGRWPVER